MQAKFQTRFKDKVAVITGAGSPIGRATAIRLVEEGAKVVLLGKTQQKLLDTAECLPQEDHSWIQEENHMTITCDITNPEQVTKMVAAVINRFERIDLLVNNANKKIAGKVSDLSVTDWHKSIDVNLTGTFYVSQAVMKHLTESKGNIVNISSSFTTTDSSLAGSSIMPAYQIAKAGLANLTKTLATEHLVDGVRVNSISCQVHENNDMSDNSTQEEGIAGVIAFLASDEAAMITGVNIPVDGGASV